MAYDPNQARAPKGSPDGGQWVPQKGDLVSIVGRSSAFKVHIVGEAGIHVKTMMGSDVGIVQKDRLRLLQKAKPPAKPVYGGGETFFAPLSLSQAQRVVQTQDYQPWALVRDAKATVAAHTARPPKKGK